MFVNINVKEIFYITFVITFFTSLYKKIYILNPLKFKYVLCIITKSLSCTGSSINPTSQIYKIFGITNGRKYKNRIGMAAIFMMFIPSLLAVSVD